MGIGGMKNALAANALALELNIRYNIQYNDMTRAAIRSQRLDCINLHDCITICNANGDCRVHFFDALGFEHDGSFTIGGLQDLVNLYLSGSLSMTVGQKVIYGTALNQSLLDLNTYFGRFNNDNACDGFTEPDNSELESLLQAYGNDFNVTTDAGTVVPDFELTPNPTKGEVMFSLIDAVEGKEVTLELFNSLGQKVFHKEYGTVSSLRDRLELGILGSGLYFVSLKVGGERFEQKLVIDRQ
jgi:hypothetical protein